MMSQARCVCEEKRVFSGGVWEHKYRYARAVIAGDRVTVSGCTATVDGVAGVVEPVRRRRPIRSVRHGYSAGEEHSPQTSSRSGGTRAALARTSGR